MAGSESQDAYVGKTQCKKDFSTSLEMTIRGTAQVHML